MVQPTDPQPSNIVSKKESSALNVSLHPLVIMNISDHHTRVKAQTGVSTRVIGALVGVQEGRNVEICNSFELIYDLIPSSSTAEAQLVVDIDYLKTKQTQFRTVFPKYDFLGWYSTGPMMQPTDIAIHKQFLPFNESPHYLFLKTGTTATSSSNATAPIPIPSHPSGPPAQQRQELPIWIYESELHIVDDEPRFTFSNTQFKIETGEAERISVDHVAHTAPAGSADSMLTSHMVGLRNAITMLHSRIRYIEKFLQKMKNGEVPRDHELLRQISSLCNMLPTIDNNRFNEEYLSEYNDALLVTYMAAITKTTSSINDLLEKHTIASDQLGLRHRYQA